MVTGRAAEEPTFGAVVREFDRRLRTLKMLVLLRTSDQDADTADLLRALDSHLRAVESDVAAVRSMMAEEQRAIEAAKALGHRAHTQAARVQVMQARLPAHLPGDARLAAERAAGVSSLRAAHPVASAGAGERRPLGESNAHAASARKPRAAEAAAVDCGGEENPHPPRKTAVVPTLAYLTTDELASAPAYMKSRLSLEKMNSAVDEVQVALCRKYELMRAPTRSLSLEQKKAQSGYKQLELEHPKLKGLLFISEEDLRTARHVRQDQTGKNILSVLRHVQRLKEVSAGGLKCWFMV
ncbi:hypothetical protein T492DRAFT_1141257 [Pavlovales sp. CCMP2436]|nr:hypothetical protein T492DRAFT_1141257 [Pavlovales sp. CCMP2436]